MNEKCYKHILTDNGYAVPDRTDGYNYYYYVRDYQGNIRAVLDEAGNVVESNGYYPYGMPYADNYTSVQPYKYGGKELDRTNGLDMSCRYAYLLRRMRKFVSALDLYLSICIIFTIQLIRIVDEKDCGTFMRVVGDDGIAGV